VRMRLRGRKREEGLRTCTTSHPLSWHASALLVLEGLVDAERRRIKIGVDDRRCDVLREDQRRRWGPRELRDLRGMLPVKAQSE
jgi:hypothetical protein